MPKVPTDYSKTIIYKLCCLDHKISDIYIGHTTNFIKRKNQHKISINNEKNNFRVYTFIREHGGWENWKMIQIEEINCNNKREAEAVEHEWIEQLGATLNSVMPHAMCKEQPEIYKHNWYEEKKDYILEKAKDYYEENKEKKLEYQKEYAENNQEKIKEYLKEYQEKNKDTISEKNKIYRETHKEALAEMQKKWRENHKEEIKEKQKGIFVCDCGHTYTFGNRIRHLQSKTYVEYQEKLYNNECEKEEQLQMLEEDKASNIQEQIMKKKGLQKEYREKNAESIKNIKKKYNDNHKEQTKEYSKKYYEEKKDYILEKTKKYSEENKEKTKVCKDEWYQKNKEKILAKQKEVYTCECGATVRIAGRAEHNRSTKHSTFLTTL